MEEIFKDIEGYEGTYQISNKGRVRTRIRSGCSVEFLKPMRTKKGYLKVDLRKPHQRKNATIHRLVAMAFLPNPLNLPEINHKDENKENNSVENLEWCEHLYNIQYGTGHARGVEPLKRKVNQYDLLGNLVKVWGSVKDAHRETGLNDANISKCCNGVNNTYRGYIWLYADSEKLEEELARRVSWLADGNMAYGKKKKVLQLSTEGELIKEYPSIREASRRTGIESSLICHALKNGNISKGYHWQISQ